MTLMDIAEELICSYEADDADTAMLADAIWAEYGPIDHPDEITPEDAQALIDAAR